MKYPQVVSMPSAVSDWLEEQLEARGIDSVVYTRYILSLLHRDSADLICPDQDSCFTHSCKEVRRSGASRKRFRRPSDWWTYDQADVDQLKRTAAVECLMSASDQKCGIESLVDELCEKLKEINNDSNADTETVHTTTTYSETSAQELANQYYAAFPPLSRKSAAPATTANSPGVITLIPKWIASPKKKKFHYKVDTEHHNTKAAKGTGKSRLNHINKKNMGYSRKTDGDCDWEFYSPNNVKNKRNQTSTVLGVKKTVDDADARMNENDAMDLQFGDLLGNIRGLLDSPEPSQQEDTEALMNSANMRDTGKKTFIPYGANITNSIWSTNQNEIAQKFPNFNSLVSEREAYLNSTYGSLFGTNNSNKNDFESNGWPSSSSSLSSSDDSTTIAENKTRDNSFPCFSWTPFRNLEKWSDADSHLTQIDMEHRSVVKKSLLKLNHHKEKSSFAEVLRRGVPRSELFGVFGKTSTAHFLKPDAATRKVEAEKDNKEDLLTSMLSHFKPINEKAEVRGPQYVDGTSFVIPSNLDKVNYKRSESGTMYIDSEYGFAKKYYEYKEECLGNATDFTLKFSVCQNDKACQTDFDDSDYDDEVDGAFAKKDQQQQQRRCSSCTPDCDGEDDDGCLKTAEVKENWQGNGGANSIFTINSSPNSVLGEIIWSRDKKRCCKCKENTIGWANCISSDMWMEESIWNAGDVCVSCLNANSVRYPPLNQQQTELREDVSIDGEELLSDLSKWCMGQLPNAEVTCDIAEMIEPKDGKRRQSSNFYEGGGAWSFASRLKEDCLIQMSTLPTLRSVTL